MAEGMQNSPVCFSAKDHVAIFIESTREFAPHHRTRLVWIYQTRIRRRWECVAGKYSTQCRQLHQLYGRG
jgi:hypothetical protein